MSADDFNFDDLAPIEVSVSIGGKKHVIVEASGDAAIRYRNATIRAGKMVDGKLVGMDNLADAEPLLVSRCLYMANQADGTLFRLPDGQPDSSHLVSMAKVLSWPNRVQKSLFDKIMEISKGLREEDTPDALRKRIAQDQAKLDSISQRNGGAKEGSYPKDSPENTTVTSG